MQVDLDFYKNNNIISTVDLGTSVIYFTYVQKCMYFEEF
jgi:hypothetical protein